jgi:hypothetical protein
MGKHCVKISKSLESGYFEEDVNCFLQNSEENKFIILQIRQSESG